MNTNPYYKIAFAADFAEVAEEKELKKSFLREIDSIVSTAQMRLVPMKSITEVIETFHYSALAAGFVQRKAQLRYIELRENAPPEQSVFTMALTGLAGGLNGGEHDEWDEIFEESAECAPNKKTARSFAQIMSQPFSYIGKAYRAFVVTCLQADFFCGGNGMNNQSRSLNEYNATAQLMNEPNFQVIGTAIKNELWLPGNSGRSPHYTSYYTIKNDKSTRFSRVFADKLIELLSSEETMTARDGARIEEIRDYTLEVLSQSFFELHSLHIPRVCNLVLSLSNDTAGISESRLHEETPEECAALFQRQSIITTASVSVDGTKYAVNNGIISFAELVEKYSLLNGNKLALLKAAADAIRR